MRDFLEYNNKRSKTFLLYGNINDIFVSSDLRARNFQQYLVKYLKLKGYDKVIFFGDDGTKGAYTLDEESAKFFFNAKNSKKGIRPSQLMKRNRGQECDDEGDHTNSDNVSVQYARPNMILPEFISMLEAMQQKESKIAVVFYNILTSGLSQSPTLLNKILDDWEVENKDNCCIFLAPETFYSQDSLLRVISEMKVDGKFLEGESGQTTFNPITCHKVGYPREDEIKNLLNYLSIVGVGKEERKIAISCQQIDDIVEEILFCSRTDISKCNFQVATMREIFDKIGTYLILKENVVEFNKETVRKIWPKQGRRSQNNLERLNRAGWENAHQKISSAVELWTSTEECNKKLQISTTVERKDDVVDDFIERICVRNKEVANNQKVPNFILKGPPGVGKTTIANIIGDVLKEHGVLKSGHCIQVTKSDLTSSYVAGTPKATLSCIERSEEGVLFIDEAHLLAHSDGGVNNDGTGREVISTLCGAMTDPNRNFCVVIAGYNDGIDELLKIDEGFRRRFDNTENGMIILEDYKPDVLRQILEDVIKEKGYEISEKLYQNLSEEENMTPLDCLVNRIYAERDRRAFGNADAMKKLADFAMAKAQNRVIDETCFYRDKINHTWFVLAQVKENLENILNEIGTTYVGMESVKEYLEHISLEIEENKQKQVEAIDMRIKPLILEGNPGVGKTTMAKLLSRFLFALGVTGHKEPVILNASQLASRYSGGTQEIINEKIKDAQDRKGVLFIDEAHNLCTSHFDGTGGFKALMAPITDAENPIVVILATYPHQTQDVLQLDPGASRRFEVLNLPDYTGEELLEIFKLKIKDQELILQPDAERELKMICNELYRNRTAETGNAGKIENLLLQINRIRRVRCKNSGVELGSEVSRVIIEADVKSLQKYYFKDGVFE